MALLIPLKVSASPQTVRLAVETPVEQVVNTDYARLTGMPQINGVTLLGDKSAADLGLATPSQIPSVPGAYTSNPAALGASASPGSSTNWARGDHVHPKPSASDIGAQPTVNVNGLLKGNGSGGVSAAVAGTDYQAPLTAGTDYATPASVTAKADKPDLGRISLTTTWSGGGPYTQPVTVTGATVTANSKIDLQPDATALAQLISDGVTALFITNNNGTLTATAIGAETTAALTIQCTVTEVSA